jgi:hypothetical protein
VASDDTHPVRSERQTLVVTRQRTASGRKSQRTAVRLENDAGRWLLRRKDGPTFGDSELERYLDRRVSCDGFRLGDLVLAERIALVADDAAETNRNDRPRK